MRERTMAFWRLLPVVVIAAGLGLAGCSSTAITAKGVGPVETPMTVLTAADNGRTLTLKPGQTFQVELKENPSTGYMWRITSLDENIVRLLLQMTHDMAQTPVAGQPVLLKWRFKSERPGKTHLEMSNYRAWEGPEKSTERFRITIVVQ